MILFCSLAHATPLEGSSPVPQDDQWQKSDKERLLMHRTFIPWEWNKLWHIGHLYWTGTLPMIWKLLVILMYLPNLSCVSPTSSHLVGEPYSHQFLVEAFYYSNPNILSDTHFNLPSFKPSQSNSTQTSKIWSQPQTWKSVNYQCKPDSYPCNSGKRIMDTSSAVSYLNQFIQWFMCPLLSNHQQALLETP